MKVGFFQFRPLFGKPAANLQTIVNALKEVSADLIVLPELALSGYYFSGREEALQFAEDPRDSAAFQALAALCRERNLHLVLGFAEKRADKVFNSAALLGPEGLKHVYRKLHLFSEEKNCFDAGDTPLSLQEVNGAKVGMMICFDWMFPESARCLALDGAEVILHPSNLVLPHCQDAMGTRCLENGVFALTANRTGVDDRGRQSLAFTGCSQIAGPGGNVMARAPEEGECVAVEELDLGLARDKRVRERNELLRDRRPECYRTLCPREG